MISEYCKLFAGSRKHFLDWHFLRASSAGPTSSTGRSCHPLRRSLMTPSLGFPGDSPIFRRSKGTMLSSVFLLTCFHANGAKEGDLVRSPERLLSIPSLVRASRKHFLYRSTSKTRCICVRVKILDHGICMHLQSWECILEERRCSLSSMDAISADCEKEFNSLAKTDANARKT